MGGLDKQWGEGAGASTPASCIFCQIVSVVSVVIELQQNPPCPDLSPCTPPKKPTLASSATRSAVSDGMQ